MNSFHKPVLLQEALGYLRIRAGKKYIDATLGGGGHSFEILKHGGIVLGIDVDQDALDYVQENFKFQISNFKLRLVRGNFKDIDRIAHEHNFDKVSGILFDLGMSSFQVDTGKRGFSLSKEGPLDMRMDKDLAVSAKDLVNVLSRKELYGLFVKFGEENNSWKISGRIVSARKIKKIETTDDLARIIQEVFSEKFSRINTATRVFQALRITVNDELNSLQEALPKALELLREGGRVCVISFHSLEDRIVKKKFIEFEDKGLGKIVTKKPIVPTLQEIEANKRARSAKLRVFEKN